MNKKDLLDLGLKSFGAIIFAVIVMGFVFFGGSIFYNMPEPTQKRGYTIDIANTPPATMVAADAVGGASVKDVKPVDIMEYLVKADLKLGEQLIKKCTICHGFEKGKPNGVGPNQYNLIGKKSASNEGFEYSDAMKAKDVTWNFQELSEFLAAPQAYVSGTKMAFAGLKKPEERAALIAYINANFSDKPVEIIQK